MLPFFRLALEETRKTVDLVETATKRAEARRYAELEKG
jgi:hypothetical protein